MKFSNFLTKNAETRFDFFPVLPNRQCARGKLAKNLPKSLKKRQIAFGLFFDMRVSDAGAAGGDPASPDWSVWTRRTGGSRSEPPGLLARPTCVGCRRSKVLTGTTDLPGGAISWWWWCNNPTYVRM